MKKIIFQLLIFFLPLNFLLNAQQIHVNKHFEGETGSGTEANPYKTIQQAVDAATPGDKIIVKAGIYREQVEIGVDSITITAFQDDEVTIKGTEPILEWEHVTGELYKAIVPWDVDEWNQENQVFVDGKMIDIARWPDNKSLEPITMPTAANASSAEESSNNSIILNDPDFQEPSERWRNSKIWVNTARDGRDGYGSTSIASYTSSANNFIKVLPPNTFRPYIVGNVNFGLGYSTEYYLFDPHPQGVYLTGGPDALLSKGEWWKNGDTLYIKTPDGSAPSSDLSGNNLVEAKKRCWAFIPANDGVKRHHITIKKMNLFACSITTERDFEDRAVVAYGCHDWLLDSLEIKYIFHTMDATENWQGVGVQYSGLILSGTDHVFQNSSIQYSALSAISAIGNRHKIIGNEICDINYLATESGVINSGERSRLVDPEVAYNFLHNSPHAMIQLNNVHSSDTSIKGKPHFHHNILLNYMRRSYDGGGFSASAGRSWDWMRIDHNVIGNSPNVLTQGIYLDFGGNAILDHNVIFNCYTPMGLNRYEEVIGEIYIYNNTSFSVNLQRPGLGAHHVNPSGEGLHIKNNIIGGYITGDQNLANKSNNLIVKSGEFYNELFTAPSRHDFRLDQAGNSAIDKGTNLGIYNDTIVGGSPDIGAYEYGAEPWIAGPGNIVTNLSISPVDTTVYAGDTIQFQAQAFMNVFMETTVDVNWKNTSGARMIEPGLFVTDSVGRIEVMVHYQDKIKDLARIKVEERSDPNTSISPRFNKKGELGDIIIYPNPVVSTMNISLVASNNKPLQGNLSIYSLSNQIIKQQNILVKAGLNEWQVNLDELKNGAYILKVETPEVVETRRILKLAR